MTEKNTLSTETQTIETENNNIEETSKSEKVIVLTDEIRQALDILIQGVEIGQKDGCYSLQDAGYIATAVDILSRYCRN